MTLSIATVSLLSIPSFAEFDIRGVNLMTESITVEPRGQSGLSTFTVAGKSYSNYTSVNSTLISGAYGSTTIKSNSGSVGEGCLYAHANLYDKAGNVIKTADWRHNSSSTTSFTNKTANGMKKGTFYTKGTTKVYNGNGYTTQSANRSPDLTISSVGGTGRSISPEESPDIILKNVGGNISSEELNERMHLYETKAMISAIGLNNTHGYVSLNDLYDTQNEPKTLEEAIMYGKAKAIEEYRLIPLYDNDGETVIGQYKIDRGITSEDISQ